MAKIFVPANSQLSEESQFMNLLATWLSTKHTANQLPVTSRQKAAMQQFLEPKLQNEFQDPGYTNLKGKIITKK